MGYDVVQVKYKTYPGYVMIVSIGSFANLRCHEWVPGYRYVMRLNMDTNNPFLCIPTFLNKTGYTGLQLLRRTS